MADPSPLLKDGEYARKQIFCPSRVVAWSHGSRFALARSLVLPRAGGRLLDYGCGDGTFIAMVHASFRESLGVDVDFEQLQACRDRLGALSGVSFDLTSTVAQRREATRRWDVITCMEVLEHCLEDDRRRIVVELRGLVAADGLVVISVPIEIGPSLAGKQFFRALAGLRRLGDYQFRERYGPLELARAVVGARTARVGYEGHGPAGPYRYYGHKGFDYRTLEEEIAAVMKISRRIFTPLRWAGPLMNSQVWFVCEAG